MGENNKQNQFIIYEDYLEVRLENETIWLSQSQLAQLFQVTTQNITIHLKNIFLEKELSEDSTCKDFLQVQKEGNREVSRSVKHYNLDMIISLGYRINSSIATQFRIWATKRLKEYIVKGFSIDSKKLKNLGGGNYWKELLEQIRDIRSSEKVLYRQVLDLYSTAIDYDSKNEESIQFFKIVQNKLHFASHGNTASEVIYLRVDSDKPFVGLTNFKGKEPTQAEVLVAKNFLSLDELKILNNLVSAYFDLAEINALEEKPMTMQEHITQLDNILQSTNREVLNSSGKISKEKAEKKAKLEYKKYKNKTLSEVEKDYLKSIKKTQKKISKKLKNQNGREKN